MRDPLDELNRGLIDQSTFDALKVTSPDLFRDSSPLPNIPRGPQPGTDPLTGMPIDTVQLPPGTDLTNAWKNALLFGSTGAQGGNTLAQDIVAGNVGAGSSPQALGFLKGIGNKLKEIWNRPIMPDDLVPDPRNPGGPPIHPDLLDEQWRDRFEKGLDLSMAMGGGPALPGEPGRPGTPKAPGGRPHLPGEKPTPKPNIFV